MMGFVEFQLKAGVVLALGVILFYLFLSKDVSFYRNRIWLLACVTLPWVVPLMAMPARLKTLLFGQDAVANNLIVTQQLTVPSNPEGFTENTMPWPTIVLSLVALVSLTLLLRFALAYLSVYKISRNADKSSYRGFKLRLFSAAEMVPFSFFRTIYAPKQLEQQKDYHLILDHELIHCKQWHSIDIVLAECLLLLQWWNPFVWWLRRLIAQNHEYCVDSKMLETVWHPKQYQYLLVDMITDMPGLRLVNNFNVCFTKKRIVMMNKSKSKGRIEKLKMIPIVMFLILSASAFTNPDKTKKGSRLAEHTANDSLKTEEVLSVMGYAAEDSVVLKPTSGVELHGNPKINVVDKSKTPLVIIDGQESSIDVLHNLDAKTVKVVDVIKDETATKEYGNKGEHGVIKVTTKGKGQATLVMPDYKKGSLKIVKGHDINKASKIKFKYNQQKNMPLIFVDGTEMPGKTLDTMDPTSIESINVLKGEAATREYGKKGEHGVIRIRLKK